MQPVFTKLNFKDQNPILVVNAPGNFESELAGLPGIQVLRNVKDAASITFSLAFVTKQSEVDMLGKTIAKKAAGDAVVWFAYPKGTSKKYKSEINRDNGWQVLGSAGFEPVRMVAIDDDWSAVRFRRASFIKTMTRAKEGRLSPEGRARLKKP